MQRVDNLIELINNIVDVEQKKIDDKNVEVEEFEVLLAFKTCDELTTWLTEIEIRVSNLNWSQKSLFWTNWIQLNQRLKFDWSTRRTQRRYFYLYVVQSLFWIVFLFFRQNISLLCRDVRAKYIFRKHWNDILECMKKNVIDITRKTSSRKILESRIEFDDFDVLIILLFDDSILKLICVKVVIKNYRSRNARVNLSNNFSRAHVACRMSHINFLWCRVNWHHSFVAVM